jgi:hypothetical protein
MDPSTEVPRERTSVVLGVVLALAGLGGLVWVMVDQPTRTLAAGELAARWFGAAGPPLGLVVAEAQRLPRGDVVLRLEDPAAPEEPPRNEPTPGDAAPADPPQEGAVEPPSKAGPDEPPFDWSKVPVGPAGALPREVLLVDLPPAEAAADLERLFRQGQEFRGDWKSIERSGGTRVLDRGRMPWGGFDAPYVHERTFEAGGTFRDVLRVDLSEARSPRILIARWTRGLPASKPPVEALLVRLENE